MELRHLDRIARLHVVAPLALAFALVSPALADAAPPTAPTIGSQVTQPTEPCAGDLDADGHVGFSDLLASIARYGATNNAASSFAELLQVLSHYGAGCGAQTR